MNRVKSLRWAITIIQGRRVEAYMAKDKATWKLLAHADWYLQKQYDEAWRAEQ